ncbi:MAG: hypothetical protein A2Y78_00160 [Acidobacteria bacterium RBG_13_68_16]|nr:MAG: hypothetical protein A2Y78_00160 [Acidobacteria bacterium RBG_13_68_16]
MNFGIKNYIPTASEQVTDDEHNFAKRVHCIRANARGRIYVRLRGDGASDWRALDVEAGEYVFGEIVAVRRGAVAAADLLGFVLPVE